MVPLPLDVLPAQRRSWVTSSVVLVWIGLHLWGLAAGGWQLASDHAFTWAGVPLERLVEQGALIPELVDRGQIQRLVTGAGCLGQGALSLLLGLWVFVGAGRGLEQAAGSARTLLVLIAAVLAGSLAGQALLPLSTRFQLAGWDLILGAVGARIPMGLALGGAAGRTLVSSALAFVALTVALTLLVPGGRVEDLVGEGAGFLAGALTISLLGPRRIHVAPGVAVRALATLAVLLVAVAAWMQVRQAQGDPGAAAVRRLLEEIVTTERAAKRVWDARDPSRVPPLQRQALAERLDVLLADEVLARLDGQAQLRAYLEALRPLATGELRDPSAVEQRLKRTFAAWKPIESRLYREHGLLSRILDPWR